MKTCECRLRKGGRLERCVLIFSCENTKIKTSCWTTNRRTLEATKKDIPSPRTKEKLQWDCRRGIITGKSNSIPARFGAHRLERNKTKEVLTLLEVSRHHIRLPNLGVQQRDRESDFEDSGIWLQNSQRTGRNRDSWRVQTISCVYQDPRERSCDPTRDWVIPAYKHLRVSCWVAMDWKWPVLGTEALAAAVLGGMCWHKFFLEVPNSPTTESIDSRLDHLGQTANKEGKQAIRK